MDDVDMDTGIIPIRHSSLPGQVRLPTRYECAGVNRNSRTRKISQAQPRRRDCLGERLDDLMTAMMWVKQELILLRQHDILLKRQFFNIQDTILSLKPKTADQNDNEVKKTVTFDCDDNFLFENFIVRPSSSVTMLNGLEETDEEDVNDGFRPRTCSMRTSRDLAALARRRGSKDLV